MTVLTKAGDVADEIVSRLETITIANGAETDIGTKVLEGRRKSEDDTTPSVTLVEAEDQPETAPGKLISVKITQRYIIIGYNACDLDRPNKAAHAMIRDIKRALFRGGDATFGGRVKSVEYRGRSIGIRADGTKMVQAVVEFDVTYVEDVSNP